jgi:hypothetical protein
MSDIFAKQTEQILAEGLRAVTAACDALTEQNKVLNKDIDGLKNKVNKLEDKLLLNS